MWEERGQEVKGGIWFLLLGKIEGEASQIGAERLEERLEVPSGAAWTGSVQALRRRSSEMKVLELCGRAQEGSQKS